MMHFLILISLISVPPKDSLGVETVNGKLFVIHQVDEKETLFAISRRYHTTVEAIIEYNADAEKGIDVGQILKVPYTPKRSYPPDAIVHTVTAKETLYSISQQYDVSIDDIRTWNNFSGDALAIGQELVIRKNDSHPAKSAETTPTPAKGQHIVAAQETLFSISRQYGVTVQQLREWNDLENADLKIGQTLIVAAPKKPETSVVASASPTAQPKQPVTESAPVVAPVKETVVQPHTIRISESVKNGSETIESGIAELIEGTEGNRKYLALHRTAPIGTILKIRNEMNNREVFVRVMGRLPDTALTDKVLIRISKSAYDRLGAIDQRFRVEVTYYK